MPTSFSRSSRLSSERIPRETSDTSAPWLARRCPEPSAALVTNLSMAATRPAEALTERRRRLAGVETRTLTVAGEGPPVLLLHGYADSADTWRAILSRFAAAGRAATAL